MLNTMKQNDSKSFGNISNFSLRSWSPVMLFIFVSVKVFSKIWFLAIILQVKAGQNYD